MPSPLLGSNSNGTAALLTEWQLPAIDILGDNVELVAAIAVRPARTIVPPAGWDEIRTDIVNGGTTRYGLYQKNEPTENGPYEDEFTCTGGATAWTAMQLAFRSLPVSQPDNDDATLEEYDCLTGGADSPPVTANIPSTPDGGNVVVAMAGSDGCGGPYTGDRTWDWSAGWTPLAEVLIPVVAGFSFAYRVVDGSPEDEEATSTYNLDKRSMGYTAIFELAVEPTPAAVPVAWDVYEIAAPGDSIEFVATLDDATAKAIRPVRNEPGSGQFTVNRSSPNATEAILKPGNLVKVRIPAIDSDYINSFFMERGDFTLISPDEEGGEDFTFGGRGGLSYWDRAIWLSERFTIPWWPEDADDPPAGAIGMLRVAADKYAFYDVGVVSGHTRILDRDDVTVGAFDAYYDQRRTLLWPVSEGGPGGYKRRLVHFMAGEPHDTRWMHPTQEGVEDFRATYAIGDTVLLSDISPDTPGAVLYRLYQEATDPARPTQPIPLMTIDFTETTDSNGDPWATTDALAGITAELGETYLDTIAKLLSTGVIDVEMGPNLDMHAYNGQGRDLTGTTFGAGKVRFVKGVNIADELRRERDDNPVATFIEVVGTDNNIGRAVLPDAASRVARETSATGDSDDETVLEALGHASLNARLIKSDAIGFRIATGDDDAAGLYLPGPEGTNHGKFWLGDVITLHTGTGEQDFNQSDQRVFAVTITEDEAGNVEATPEVGSVLGEAERRLFANNSIRAATFQVRSQFNDSEVAETQPVTAADIEFVPAGPLSSTDVQAAIEEAAALAGAGIFVNVMDYGAVGDDTADDTAAIQAAIDVAEVIGGTVFFPRGTYKITATLTSVASGGYIAFLGEGGPDTPASKIHMATANTTAFYCDDGYDTTFENLYIYGPGSASSGSGIHGHDRNIHTSTCRIEGFFYGVRLGNLSYYSKHDRALFYLNASAGVWIESGANNAMFVDCRFHTNGIGLRIDGAQSVKVIGGAIESNTTSGIAVDRVGGGQITDATYIAGVYFEGNGSASIKIGDTAEVRSTTILGCHFTSPHSGYFIDAEHGDYITIGACHFLGAPSSGDIRLQAAVTHAVLFNNRPSGVGNTYTATPIILENLGSPAFATPAIVLGTAAAAGAASTVIRSDATIVAFDATAPSTQALGDSAATGSAAVAARRDHKHAMPALSSATPLANSGSGAVGTALPSSREDHVHPASGFGSGVGPLVLASDHGTPIVFDDILQASDGSDFIYASEP